MKSSLRYAMGCLVVGALLVSALVLRAAGKSRMTTHRPVAGAPASPTSRLLEHAPGAAVPTSSPAEVAPRRVMDSAFPSTRPNATTLTVYYFHRTIRCPTCLRIEELARDATQRGFENEVAAGQIKWQAIDIDKPENAHFERDFDLKVQSLVIVRSGLDQRQQWTNMKEIWDLVDDPAAFTRYVQNEIRRDVNAHPTTRP